MQTSCIVVIGHVNHGKTALVHALTGIKTDNLPEEKSRGLSITPGFAHYAYSDGVLDFIDAPGHEDFIQAIKSGDLPDFIHLNVHPDSFQKYIVLMYLNAFVIILKGYAKLGLKKLKWYK